MSAVIGSAGIAARQDQQPLDVVAQLADVARPVVRLQHGHGVVADGALRQAGRLGDLLDEMVDQLGMSSRRSARPGTRERHHVQAVEQVLAERPSAISRSRSRAVDEMMRTSTCTLVAPPTRWKV